MVCIGHCEGEEISHNAKSICKYLLFFFNPRIVCHIYLSLPLTYPMILYKSCLLLLSLQSTQREIQPFNKTCNISTIQQSRASLFLFQFIALMNKVTQFSIILATHLGLVALFISLLALGDFQQLVSLDQDQVFYLFRNSCFSFTLITRSFM